MRTASPAELRTIPLFATLTSDELESVSKVAIVKDYPQGTALFFEGMPANVLHVVLSGRVEIFKKTIAQETKLNELKRGDYLGEVSLADSQPRSASARTIDDAALLIITRDSFERLLRDNLSAANKLLLHFFKVLAQRLRRAEQRAKG